MHGFPLEKKSPITKIFAGVFFLFLLSGCVALNMPLLSQSKPLEEKLIEGKGKQKILLLDLDGTISFEEKKDILNLRKESSAVVFFAEALSKAESDRDIAGIIVRINSPGGGVAATDTVYHEIMKFRGKRQIPVTAFITGIAASGGYYVASACDRIVASPASVVGSIGVVAMKFNIEGLMAKFGVAEETYKSGPKKDFWSPFRPSTPEEQKMMQTLIDNLYSRFLDVAYAGRRHVMSQDELKELADGRVLTASDALTAKLIDEIAYLDESIEQMKEKLHLEKARVVTYARRGEGKTTIYSGSYSPVPQVISLISLNAGDLPLSGVHFMYLWNP